MNKKAFTLVELLIIIAIIGILTGIASVSYSGIQARGRDAQRQNDLSQIKIALSTYYNAQIPYQYVTSAMRVTINGTTDVLTTTLTPNYIKEMPVDPLNSGNNVYRYQSFNSAKNFKLFATLENKNNKKGWAGGVGWVFDGYIVQDE